MRGQAHPASNLFYFPRCFNPSLLWLYESQDKFKNLILTAPMRRAKKMCVNSVMGFIGLSFVNLFFWVMIFVFIIAPIWIFIDWIKRINKHLKNAEKNKKQS